MRVFRLLPALLLLTSVGGFTQTSSSSKPAPGFSLDNVDKTIDPCVDFYQYACGNWIKNSKIPPDQSQWGSFVELRERNLDIEHDILEKAAAGGASRNAIDQRIGDLYGSCMDEKAVNPKGIVPLKPELDRIAAVPDKGALIDEIAHVHLTGPSPLFNFYSAPDLHNADQVIAYIDQGGLTLPDRDYYIKDDPDKVEKRQFLVDYATQLFTLAGQTPQQAAHSAQTVLVIETMLAVDSMDRTKRRDPKNRDHKMTRDEAAALGPNFYLDRYFTAVGAPNFTQLNVTNPEFFKLVNGVLEVEPLDALKTYVSWHVLNAAAPWLSQPFVEANFKLQQKLTGQEEIQARWKRCVNLTDHELGEALGQKYVEATFGPDGRQRMLKMVDALEKSLTEDIHDLSWMSDETKKQAKLKLDAIRNKIGYPDVYRDYSSVVIKPDDLLGNIARADEFESKREIAKIDKPLDRREWGMTPPTVNAFYSAAKRSIIFPAGILQPPFFDKQLDDGSQLRRHRLRDRPRNDPRIRRSGPQIRSRWESARLVDGEGWRGIRKARLLRGRRVLLFHVGGRREAERTPDAGREHGGQWRTPHGVWRWHCEDTLKQNASNKVDGFTPEQRFFLGFAQLWCENSRRRNCASAPSPTRIRLAAFA